MGSASQPRVAASATPGSILVNIYDGTRSLLKDRSIIIRLRDGNQKQVSSQTYRSPSVRFTNLISFENFGDDYTVLASPAGYHDAGFFPVQVAAGEERVVHLLALPKSAAINFARAKWNLFPPERAKLKAAIAAGLRDENAGAQRYNDLTEVASGAVSACMLNLLTSMEQAPLPRGSVLGYVKEIVWDRTGMKAMAPDRLFCWVDPELISQLETAKAAKKFAGAPFSLHPGATRSYKQTTFGEANLQLTFHENDWREIAGQRCILAEPDIDYYRNLGAHVLLEVVLNAFGSLTDPKQAMALRWMAARQTGGADFDPLYTVESA